MNFRLALLLAIGTAPAIAASCESLASLSLPATTITKVETVSGNPAYCRVAATLKPSSDSDIKIEVWMPASGWNGKFQAVGNGGWAGTISYAAMAQALARRYATTSTDTGHSTPGASFAFGHPEKLIDYAYRSEHEMTVHAKTVIEAFYGKAPERSYFNGCS